MSNIDGTNNMTSSGMNATGSTGAAAAAAAALRTGVVLGIFHFDEGRQRSGLKMFQLVSPTVLTQ